MPGLAKKKRGYLLLALIMVCPIALSCLADRDGLAIAKIYQKYKQKEINRAKVEGRFGEVYPEEPQSNTREYIYNSDIRYFKTENGKYSYDEIEIYGKRFLLIGYDYMQTGDTFLLDANPDRSTVYQFDYNHKKFLCLELVVTKSGMWQEISDYALFDVTDLKNIIYYAVSGRFAPFDAFGDYNGDGVLDFALIQYDPDCEKLQKDNCDSLYYRMSFLTLDQGEVEPIAGLSEIVLEKDKNSKFHVVSE
jgi:hypothetical protein